MNAEAQGPPPFERLGGEPGVRALVDRFYDLMDLEPIYAGIRALHPTELDSSRDKLHWFLCGWLGGPNLYIERFGHPRLRARHMPYSSRRFCLEHGAFPPCVRRTPNPRRREPLRPRRFQSSRSTTPPSLLAHPHMRRL